MNSLWYLENLAFILVKEYGSWLAVAWVVWIFLACFIQQLRPEKNSQLESRDQNKARAGPEIIEGQRAAYAELNSRPSSPGEYRITIEIKITFRIAA